MGNRNGPEYGLETADMNTFKKDPLASLARETCQNSIDARKNHDKPVVVEFNSFKIKRENIPQVENLTEEIVLCRNYQSSHPVISNQLLNMALSIATKEIECLRVSDFNTKGLSGVYDHRNSPFYLLTKGSALTDKIGTAGGSKGIGKFASFVASSFNTVFYSTLNLENEVGHIGISKLCSREIVNSSEKTIGTGYYCSNESLSPIDKAIYLDENFRDRKETGTDIYILGFRKESNWKTKIISKILESFMAAIVFGELEVIVDGTKINKISLSELIQEGLFIERSLKNSIKAQYYLLTNQKSVKETIEIGNYGKVDVYLTGYDRENVKDAINECIMIRYPYMKIKALKIPTQIPFSAVCVIPKSTLNEMLREIENPQHTDWEVERVDESRRFEIRKTIKEMKDKIQGLIESHLANPSQDQTDLEGASEYLPGFEEGDSVGGKSTFVDKPIITKPTKKRVILPTGTEPNEDGNVPIEDVGGNSIEGNGTQTPNPAGGNLGRGNGEQGELNEEGGFVDGEGNVKTFLPLSGTKFRFIVTNQNKGEYVLTFTSLYDEPECVLYIFSLDDGNQKYPINIIQAELDGTQLLVENNKVKKLGLKKDQRCSIKLKTNQFELFSCEVKLYAYR